MRTRLDNSDGLQVHDVIFKWWKIRVIVAFDSFYSDYGSELNDDYKKPRTITEFKNNEFIYTTQRRLFILPWKIKYSINNGDKVAFKASPQVWVVTKTPKFIKVQKSLIRSILKYCEDNAIYNKLGQYGDFYYKLQNKMNNE